MQSTFKVIIDTEQGREVHPAANLSEAIDIYRQKLDEYPQSQIHLLRDMPSTAPAPDGSPDGTAASPAPKVERHGQIDRRYKQQLDGVGNPDCPLYGKIVRITGTFDQLDMTRDQVAAACQQLGAAEASDGICKKMDIVIIGNNPGPSKLEKIAQWRSEGCSIQTLDQLQIKEIIDKFSNN